MSISGNAAGGSGFDHGPGGNAYTGSTGKTHGGDIINHGGAVMNTVDVGCKFFLFFREQCKITDTYL